MKYLGLDAGNELQLPGAQLAAQEAINIQRLFRIDAIDDRQRVERNSMLLQLQPGGEYFVECRLAAFVHAIAVMQLLRAIDAQPDQELVFAQKLVPLVI